MIKRCIMIFPEFENIYLIEGVRERFDPLYNHVRPHITLVFPFNSNLTAKDINNHITNVTKRIVPFKIRLKGVSPANGKYLFLNVIEGKEEIKNLYKVLNTGCVEEYTPLWLKNGGYDPHLTVGNINEESAFCEAYDTVKNFEYEFETVIDKISVEIIDSNEDSIIEMEVPLK